MRIKRKLKRQIFAVLMAITFLASFFPPWTSVQALTKQQECEAAYNAQGKPSPPPGFPKCSANGFAFNAKLWDDNARAAGIPVDHKPRVGDVAISNAGTYGHAMYVEAVHGDGTITVSQYNADWKGNYSVVRRSTANLVFIHF